MSCLKKILCTLALALCAIGLSMGNVTAAAQTKDFNCNYSVGVKGDNYIYYGSTAVKTYTAEEAAAAGVPVGYENEVLEVVGSTSSGFLLDFSAQQIPMAMVEALQFRVYLSTNAANTGKYPQVRIPKPGALGSEWVFQEGEATPTGEWATVTVPSTKGNFSSLGENGILNKFELSVRSNAVIKFYVDSIQYVLKKPVIKYTGEETLSLSLGKKLNVPASATDAQGNPLTLEYIWENGVTLNANGTPTQMGTYTLTLKAVDSYGGVATKVVRVEVSEGDEIPPVIAFKMDEVKTTVGAKPMLSVSATDNNGAVTVTKTWSDGALDKRGGLTAGEHTWTITAVDKFGNVATKVVRFIVTENEPTYSFVLDESKDFEDCTVTFDGQNPISVPYGFKIAQPDNPVKEETAEATYQFIGWFVGDKEWNFETDVVTRDLDIQSKWEATKKAYTVSFDGKDAAQKVEYGSVIPAQLIPEDPQKPSTTRKEFTFAGWYLGEDLWDFETDVVTGNTALVARFTESPRLYTVTFDGGNEQYYQYGAKIEKPETPVRESTATVRYEFIGWFYLAKEWNFDTDIVNYDIDLQSKWSEIAIETPNNSAEQTDSDNQSGGENKPFGGCSSTANVAIGGITALVFVTVARLKKKEN